MRSSAGLAPIHSDASGEIVDREDAPVVPLTVLRKTRTLARGAALSIAMPSLLIVGREPRGTPNSAGAPVSAEPMIVIDRFVPRRSPRR
jgi:hypothetical protein